MPALARGTGLERVEVDEMERLETLYHELSGVLQQMNAQSTEELQWDVALAQCLHECMPTLIKVLQGENDERRTMTPASIGQSRRERRRRGSSETASASAGATP